MTLEWEYDGAHAEARDGDRVYVGYFYGTQPQVPQLAVAEGVCRKDGRVAVAMPPAEEEGAGKSDGAGKGLKGREEVPLQRVPVFRERGGDALFAERVCGGVTGKAVDKEY